jgi:hypothetical protein
MAVENRTGYFASPHKTASEFTSANEVLPKGVTGTESDTQKTKCGDGLTTWTNLDYNPGTVVSSVSSNKFKPLTVGVAGDSIGVLWGRSNGYSPIWWFANYVYPCNIDQMFSSAVGGTLSSNLLEQEDEHPPQIDALLALGTKPDLMIIQTTQNDSLFSNESAVTVASYVTSYATQILAAGVKNVIIAGHPPNLAGSNSRILVTEYLNRILSGFANITEGVFYIDTLGQWRAIPTTEDSTLLATGWRSGYSEDGTHPVTKAMYETSKSLLEILRPMVQPRLIESTVAVEYIDAADSYTNVLGANGLVLGTNGVYNTVTNSNVAGISTDSGDHWDITDGNGVVATPSIIIGEDGYNYQQIVLSGTATADISVVVRKISQMAVTIGNFKGEGILHLNDITGVDSIRYDDGVSYSTVTSDGLDLVGDHKLHIVRYGIVETAQWAGNSPAVTLSILNGNSPTGTIQLGRVGVYRQVG